MQISLLLIRRYPWDLQPPSVLDVRPVRPLKPGLMLSSTKNGMHTAAYIDRLNAATRAEEQRAFQAKFNEEAIRMRPNHPVKRRHFTAARVIHDALPPSRLDVFDPSGDEPEFIPFENVNPMIFTSSRKWESHTDNSSTLRDRQPRLQHRQFSTDVAYKRSLTKLCKRFRRHPLPVWQPQSLSPLQHRYHPSPHLRLPPSLRG